MTRERGAGRGERGKGGRQGRETCKSLKGGEEGGGMKERRL